MVHLCVGRPGNFVGWPAVKEVYNAWQALVDMVCQQRRFERHERELPGACGNV